MQDDIRGYRGLMSAVVTRAVLDSLVQPNSRQKFSPIARSAIKFLMGNDVGLYLEFVDIDRHYFKEKFISNMFDDADDPQFSAAKKRMFRLNYKRYIQEENRALILAATYKTKKVKITGKKKPHRRLAS